MKKYLLLLMCILPLLCACWKDILVISLTINATELTLTEGETYRLEAMVTPSDATDKSVTWESSSPEIAKVENGVVTALKKGEAVITVKTVDGGKTASCKINVDTNNSFDNPLTDEDWDW